MIDEHLREATDPSSRWPVSSSAMIVRPTATAVPLSVCRVSGLASSPAGRTRISSRRAWKSVVFDVDVSSR